MSDWILYFLFSAASRALRWVPIDASLAAARLVGRVYALLPSRGRLRALVHIKVAFPQESPAWRRKVARSMFERFAQNAVEVLYVPYLDERRIRSYVRLSGEDAVRRALDTGKGVLLLGVHAGSWELSNIACAVFFPQRSYAMLAQPQKRTRRLDSFLNKTRERKGCHVIGVGELKKMMAHLSAGNILGMVADHGGRDGLPVSFFGKQARVPVGSMKLAQKLGSRIVLAFVRRVQGPQHELSFSEYEPVFTGEDAVDLHENLRRINAVFERFIRQYPEEYLWTYRRWKHGPQKDVLVLNDGKAGHLKQSQALCAMLREAGFDVRARGVDVVFKSGRWRKTLAVVGRLFGPRLLWRLLPLALTREASQELYAAFCDAVVSAGSSLAAVNLACAYENQARSIAIMRPGVFSGRQFDLVIMPEHDRPRPQKNVVVTVGALSHITREDLESDFNKLAAACPSLRGEARRVPRIGLLLGGDSKNYALTPSLAAFVCDQMEKALDGLGAELVITTSRRTAPAVADVVKGHFRQDPRCRLIVVAREHNPEGTVDGIFFWSDVLVVSGDSISMVSEACTSGRPVVVFEPHTKKSRNKVDRFLGLLAAKRYIEWVKPSALLPALEEVLSSRYERPVLDPRPRIIEALKQLF